MVFLASTTSNLGIALRHKLMFLPPLIIIVLDLSVLIPIKILIHTMTSITNKN